ncbi:putative oxygen-independent coproporphyrinogen III oxidase domain protein [Burkholderia pseudomallei MSHR3458]|nr:putative oxygen-independent coproporphyrinogen III oxidase domain protein [Burkholderia pseudomallei MSHR2243]AIV71732.1 putative oxygen-independent coproporphyrinogen III oxidase domain protein [Burkholderia pseudomallei MSHR62]KGW69046.1 putative oxygen-independent coproporphyrinogen III oxidase domain protein [Burkholderia pseudomallei MSHR3458]KGX31508.1 putative oxygen-independent coproporphyrinogen III oxidase domain protein [Burkholderia pseudomallei MSHR3709]
MFRGALKYRMRAEVDRGACGGAARRRFLCGLGLGLRLGLGLGARARARARAGPQSGFAAARLRLRFFDSPSGAVHETCAARERIQARAGADPVDARLGSGQIGRGGRSRRAARWLNGRMPEARSPKPEARWSMVDGRWSMVERSKDQEVEWPNASSPLPACCACDGDARRMRRPMIDRRATATRRCSTKFVPMKILVATLLAVFVCTGCASGGAGGSGAGTGRIEMYGTIDQGVTIRN